ncbi:MAG: HAD-IC family P-type ATPase, partial [Candidatus Brocadiaceae bacterium]
MPDGPQSTDVEQSASAPSTPWHCMSAESAVERLETDPAEGLGDREASRRLRQYGPNRLQATRQVRWWQVLVNQFKSVVVLLLVGAAIISFAFQQNLEGASIVVVIFLNAGLGFFTEYRASRAMEALQKLGAADATVLRSGEHSTIPASSVVPGDVLILQEGESVTADARVIESAELQVDESSLTGESVPVTKSTDALEDEGLPVADRSNMAYKGTHVTGGNGRAVVVATGMGTEIGRVSELVTEVEEEKTPLEQRLDRMGRRLIVVCLGVAAVVAASGIVQQVDLVKMLEAGIALAVAAVPEGLPAVATITLAVGMQRMARQNALVRRLPAVEALGSATCVCTDKTGTLTRSEMTLTRIVLPDREVEVLGSGYTPEGAFSEDSRRVEPSQERQLRSLLVVSALCNNATLGRDEEGAWGITGDPTEGALVTAAAKAGMPAEELRERHRELKEFPFSSSVMMMATVNDGLDEQLRPGDGKAICAKGAPGVLVEHCDRLLDKDGVRALEQTDRERILADNEEMAGRGLRVLGC